jgi:conjugative relaxase-like TrwC/TraI family protein/excisionase family DNA binding protein
MMRVTTLYAATAATTAGYYTRYLTQAPGEQPGRWLGNRADQLGLHGEVTTEALQLLLTGCHPTTGVTLGHPLVDRTLSNGKVIRAVAGFDATLWAPKSLSVLWALSGDEGLARCHDVAMRAVADYLERFGATTRVRSNGQRMHPDTQGLTIAAFRQTTSRADDPQLHTHLVISAKVQTADERWLALDARFLKRHQRTLGGLYQSVLRAELTHRYGLAFEPIISGQAEITGVPTELLTVFSKRTAEIDTVMADKLDEFYRRDDRDPTRIEFAAMQREAAADSRAHKTGRTADDLRAMWRVEAASVGVTPTSLLRSIEAAGVEHPPTTRGLAAATLDWAAEAMAFDPQPWRGRARLVAFVSFVGDNVPMSATRAEVFGLEEHDRVVVASVDSEQSSVSVRVGEEMVVLPDDASRAVRSLLRDLATGVPVHVIPADAELTTQQAADLLGLSRTYVVRLVDQGSLSAHLAGTHRRLLASDVMAYRDRRATKLAALGELTEAEEELGLSY